MADPQHPSIETLSFADFSIKFLDELLDREQDT
jgi:hypothetical protein